MKYELFETPDQTPPEDPEIQGTSDARPLASKMRPRNIDEIVGQTHLFGPGKVLRRLIEADRLKSLILFGPPGVGKTTIAKVISTHTQSHFVSVNAVSSNVGEIRKIQADAAKIYRVSQKKFVLFIDEIHRFNKAQQDLLMPDVEEGKMILIGATTQNPSFSVNNALLSRSLICELKPLEEEHLKEIAKVALDDQERGFGKESIHLSSEALNHLVESSSGDARKLLNGLELMVLSCEPDDSGVYKLELERAIQATQKRALKYDRDGDEHYDTVSAFIKSIRGSDADAAVYWLAKMLWAGEDPMFIARRMMISASEDIGNADPKALLMATSALTAVEKIGMPEARIILGHVVIYLAKAPKSNACYQAVNLALSDVNKNGPLPVPDHLRDASYSGAKRMGRGEGYIYPHGVDDEVAKHQKYLPVKKRFYIPKQSGDESRYLSD